MENSLDSQVEKEYGELYKEHLLEQYKIYLDMTDKISDRRHNMNSLFLGLNTSIVSALSIASFTVKMSKENVFFKDYIFFSAVSLLIFCFVWYRLICSYKQLNSVKFDVINEIEKKLPIKPFEYEWVRLEKGKNSSIYSPFSKIEKYVPIAYAILYFLLIAHLYIKYLWV